MRVIITETRALSLAFCREFRTLPGAGFRFSRLDTIRTRASSYVLAIAEQLGRGFQPTRLGIVLMLERGLHALRLDIVRVAIISPASGV